MADYKTIWLQPWCDGCETHAWGASGGRQWCQDDVWEDCSECGAKSVKYIIAPNQDSPQDTTSPEAEHG